ncbi:MAG TPA: hypothetical protein DDY77_01295 [Clostridiales bacterium]|nr:hypothetical protein [Clostridiales bacterium]
MWWETLNLAQKIYFCIACPATVLLVVQIILLLVGFGSGGGDVDADTDVDCPDAGSDADGDGILDNDPGITLFSVRGLVAFFAIGGWIGYTFADNNLPLAIVVSLVAGTAALVGMAFLMKWLTGLQSNGNINYNEAVGKIAEVYLTIPPKNTGSGKVTLNVSERYIEKSAIQSGDSPIPTGAKVKIISVIGDEYLVEKL